MPLIVFCLLTNFLCSSGETEAWLLCNRLLSSGSGKGGQSVRWSLVTQWIWTNEFAAVRSTQFVQLVALLMEALRLQKTHPTQVCVAQ